MNINELQPSSPHNLHSRKVHRLLHRRRAFLRLDTAGLGRPEGPVGGLVSSWSGKRFQKRTKVHIMMHLHTYPSDHDRSNKVSSHIKFLV